MIYWYLPLHVVKRPNSAPRGVSLVGPQAAASSWLID
jgi:hypothetical protein